MREAAFTLSDASGKLLAMKRRDFLETWGLSSLKIKLGFLEGEFGPREPGPGRCMGTLRGVANSRHHAIPCPAGWRRADSADVIFPLTREILSRHGSGCVEFAKLAIPVLNQLIRPLTAKWHWLSLAGAFKDPNRCRDFCAELSTLQPRLRDYTRALADIAQVEDLTALEGTGT
jgi:hypothetical protein